MVCVTNPHARPPLAWDHVLVLPSLTVLTAIGSPDDRRLVHAASSHDIHYILAGETMSIIAQFCHPDPTARQEMTLNHAVDQAPMMQVHYDHPVVAATGKATTSHLHQSPRPNLRVHSLAYRDDVTSG
jgi:hypothetical protein